MAQSGDTNGHVVKPGHLPVSEMFYDRAGAASPFGDELTFPLPADQIVYEHPGDHAAAPAE
jgi:hypothetical protein